MNLILLLLVAFAIDGTAYIGMKKLDAGAECGSFQAGAALDEMKAHYPTVSFQSEILYDCKPITSPGPGPEAIVPGHSPLAPDALPLSSPMRGA